LASRCVCQQRSQGDTSIGIIIFIFWYLVKFISWWRKDIGVDEGWKRNKTHYSMPSGGKKRKRRSRQLEAQYEKKVCDTIFYMRWMLV
jgi:hypothetical protein